MPEVSLTEWNEYLQAQPQSHFLQTGEWGELKASYGWDVVRLISGHSGAQVLFRRLPFGVQLAYIPRLSPQQINLQDGPRLWHEVDAVCSARRAIACKLEPDLWETDDQSWLGDGFVGSPQSIQPRRTIIVDLQPPDEAILSRMRQKCRYNIRLAQKKNVGVRPWSDIDAFHEMLQATAIRDGFAVHSRAYYADAYAHFHPSGMCELLLAEADGQPLAALMVFARGPRAWYVYGGSSDLQREKMPNYLLQWEA
ncbi:MAG TPA: peptidoglycan bridge formation glycyltransferase FemA/FemB family protein, partial [Anaerolineales bacterium]|nr:peptidoglycan bridge formation glycyltransferase FemA/FemB family protein [Anaerolineales bacterium]